MCPIKKQRIAVLLLAFGGPEKLDDVEPFLRNVLPGRPITPELVERVKKRYALIGGKSPLPESTRRQAELLGEMLGSGFKVYVGMRHWQPFIKDAVKQIKEDGFNSIIAIPMAPQSSKASTGSYVEAMNKALEEFGGTDVKVADAWYKNHLYLNAVAGTVKDALNHFPNENRKELQVIFSAHSLPKRTVEGDPYETQLRETMEGIVKITGPLNNCLAYQSKGQAPGEWLGPDVEVVMEEMAGKGKKDVLIVPIGFVCDHVETLYDIDILFRKKAEELGLNFQRSASLNDSPGFIEALAAIVKEAAGRFQ